MVRLAGVFHFAGHKENWCLPCFDVVSWVCQACTRIPLQHSSEVFFEIFAEWRPLINAVESGKWLLKWLCACVKIQKFVIWRCVYKWFEFLELLSFLVVKGNSCLFCHCCSAVHSTMNVVCVCKWVDCIDVRFCHHVRSVAVLALKVGSIWALMIVWWLSEGEEARLLVLFCAVLHTTSVHNHMHSTFLTA